MTYLVIIMVAMLLHAADFIIIHIILLGIKIFVDSKITLYFSGVC